jgi:hypothetical protein
MADGRVVVAENLIRYDPTPAVNPDAIILGHYRMMDSRLLTSELTRGT